MVIVSFNDIGVGRQAWGSTFRKVKIGKGKDIGVGPPPLHPSLRQWQNLPSPYHISYWLYIIIVYFVYRLFCNFSKWKSLLCYKQASEERMAGVRLSRHPTQPLVLSVVDVRSSGAVRNGKLPAQRPAAGRRETALWQPFRPALHRTDAANRSDEEVKDSKPKPSRFLPLVTLPQSSHLSKIYAKAQIQRGKETTPKGGIFYYSARQSVSQYFNLVLLLLRS